MKFFIVFQNITYQDESREGYFCSGQRDARGARCYHWENVGRIEEEDIIFSITNQQIQSVNIATSDGVKFNDKSQFDIESVGPDEGYLARANYHKLSQGIGYEHFADEVSRTTPEKGPFDKNGNGKQGYMFEISKAAGEYLIDLIAEREGDESFRELLNA